MAIDLEEKLIPYKEEGFDRDQLVEIGEGLTSYLDVSLYAKKDYYALQMYQIRLGLISGVEVEEYLDPDYDWFQMEEIRLGLEASLDVSLYAKKEYSFETMREIRKGLSEGIHLENYAKLDAGLLKEIRCAMEEKVNIIPYIKAGYVPEQLDQIREALKNKLNIDPYLSVWFRGEAIHQITLGLKEGLDVSLYADVDYDWHQMEEIRLGLEHRVDAARYAKKLAGWRQMHEMRLGLEEGLDISFYESLMYPGSEMSKRRLKLKEQAGLPGEQDQKAETEALPKAEKKKAVYDPVDLSGFQILIKDAGLSAEIDLGRTPYRISPEGLLEYCKKNQVVTGYCWDVIAKLGNGELTGRVKIAGGKKAVDGEDAFYEYLLEGKSTYQPAYQEDGRIDFGRSIWYRTVKKDEVLVKYHPAKKSIPGTTVGGKSLPGRDGRELPPLTGKGFKILPDKVTYVAALEGVITYEEENYLLKVVPLLVVETLNANRSTIEFDGTVHVKGLMEENTCIHAGEDVFVDDFVAAAEITAGGNIILKKGIRGSETGRLKAGGDIDGNFFEQVKLEAGQAIRANYCMNCDMTAKDKILVLGKQGYIVGGTATANNLIQASGIGNQTNIRTWITVGIQDELYDREKELKDRRKENESQLRILENAMDDYYARLTPEQRNKNQMFLKIEDAVYTKQAQQKAIEKKLTDLKEEFERIRKARVIVEDTVYEGCVITINTATLRPRKINRAVFRYVNGRVSYSNLTEE